MGDNNSKHEEGRSDMGEHTEASIQFDGDWRLAYEAALLAGDVAAVRSLLASVIEEGRDQYEARAQLGALLHATGDLEGACEQYRIVVAANQGGFELLNNLGVAALELGRSAEAIDAFESALTQSPDSVVARTNLAEAFAANGRFRDAMSLLQDILLAAPQDPEVYLAAAKIYNAQGWHVDALNLLQVGQAAAPNHPGLICELGKVNWAIGKDDDALSCFETARRLVPNDVAAIVGSGQAYAAEDRDDEAEACLRLLGPTPSLARFLLSRGRTEEGWQCYETRLSLLTQRSSLERALPRWRGETLAAGKSLLITSEPDTGDNYDFLRWIPKVVPHFSQVCLLVPTAMLALVNRALSGVCNVVAEVPLATSYDFVCPIGSLPAALKLSVDQWGAVASPYLKGDLAKTALWGFRLPAVRLRKVGLCWWADCAPNVVRGSLSVAMLERFLAIESVRWISLQPRADAAWAATQVAAGRLVDLTSSIKDDDDVAALIGNLDLVVTVDATVAHIAGALGKPVWLLLDDDCSWRWLRKRDDTPLYPTMRLFRRPHGSDWRFVIDSVGEALQI